MLEAMGFSVCRAGASLGVWDLIAVNRHQVRLIQVKCGARPYCSPVEREAMQMFQAPATVSKELWKWKDYSHLPEVEVL